MQSEQPINDSSFGSRRAEEWTYRSSVAKRHRTG